MFQKSKNDKQLSKFYALIKEGKAKKNILPFEQELYDRLNKIYFVGIPMSIYLKYLRPTYIPIQGLDRSRFITMGLQDSILVRGMVKDLEQKSGKENDLHGWVEYQDWVYDPITLLKFKKDLFYKIYEPKDISYIWPCEYTDDTWYQEVIQTALKDLKPNGKKREELILSIPMVLGYAKVKGNFELYSELETYLHQIDYNYNNIIDEIAYKKESNKGKKIVSINR